MAKQPAYKTAAELLQYSLIALLLLLNLQTNAQVTIPASYRQTKDITYLKTGDWDGKLDLYIPANINGTAPLIVNIHGGGWVHGQKETETVFSPFFEKGYVIANVEYRLAQQAPAPAAITDVRAAIIYLLKNQKQYHINPKQVILLGSSAGGHLALMAGLLQNNHIFDCESGTNVQVAAIIDRYGPTDLNKWDSMKKASKASSSWLGSHINDSVFIASVSPINYVSPSGPPVFIVHGTADNTVPFEQSVILKNKLTAAGVRVFFFPVTGGRHGNFSKDANQEINKQVDVFLSEIIGPAAP